MQHSIISTTSHFIRELLKIGLNSTLLFKQNLQIFLNSSKVKHAIFNIYIPIN